MHPRSRLLLVLVMVPLLAAQTKFNQDLLAMNPLGFWPLNGNVSDASNQGFNGTVIDGVMFINSAPPLGNPGAQAAVMASADGQVIWILGSSTTSFNLGALHPLTALAWVRTVEQSLGSMTVMAKFDPYADSGWAIIIDNGDFGAPQGSGRFALVFAASGVPALTVESIAAVNDGNWHLLSATYDGSGSANGVQMYIDGVTAASTILADAISGNDSIFNNQFLTIGNVPSQEDPFEGNLASAALFGTVLTPAQNLQLGEDALTYQKILSRFDFGGGWYSALYLANTGKAPVSVPVSFTADDGTPLNVPSIGGSATTLTLPAGGSALIEAPNAGPLTQGYASAILPVGVTGYGILRQSIAGAADQEAQASLANSSSQSYTMLYDETDNLDTRIAIVNPSAGPTTVAIAVSDTNGNLIGTSSLTLAPFNKMEADLRSLPGLSQIVGNRGTAQFTVTTGSITVLGLRLNGPSFTTIPATDRPVI